MKRLLFIGLLLTFVVSVSSAQRNNSFKFGALFGASAYNVDPMDLFVVDESGNSVGKLAFKDANYGLHFGAFALIKRGFLYTKPQVQFNTQTVNYTYEELKTGDVKIIKETYQDIDIPITLGFNFGPVRMGFGPVGHIHLTGKSDFFNFKEIDYVQEFKEMTFGYILGVGLDIWNFHLDFGYEGNFSKVGDHIHLFGKQVKFDQGPARFILSVGVSF